VVGTHTGGFDTTSSEFFPHTVFDIILKKINVNITNLPDFLM
jgi:hypothetical protein